MALDLAPDPRPTRVHLLVPARRAARGAVRVGLTTTTWQDPFRGREVGLHVGGQWVLARRLPGPDAIAAAIARVHAERRAEDQLEHWWFPAQTLYLPHARPPVALQVRPGDEGQLGPGWFARENWGGPGLVRWTGGRAEAYLGHAGVATRLCLRVYSGEPRLGPVAGRVVVERLDAEAEGLAQPAGETRFNLAADQWGELAVPLAAPAGPLRITIEVTPPLRVPRELIPESRDERGLGLVVQRIWLA
jgi:hypothetical protein